MKVLAQMFLCWLALGVAATAAADEPISYAQGARLMAKYNCQSCHLMDRTSVGPSLLAIAEKYASDPTADIELEHKVVNGSTGVWGPLPMAAVAVPDQDLRTLIHWILSLR
jgi:cytochrome c